MYVIKYKTIISFIDQSSLMKKLASVFLTSFFSIILCVLSLQATHAQATNDTLLAFQYYKKADSLLVHRYSDSSIVYFKKALSIYEKAKAQERVVACYNGLSSNYIFLIEDEKAMSSMRQALSLCNTHKLDQQKSKVLDNLGDYYYYIKSNNKKAEEYYKKALNIREKLAFQYPSDLYNFYINLARINIYKGKYEDVRKNVEKALALITKHHGSSHYKIADIYDIKGHYHLRKWNFEQARDNFEKSLNIRKEYFGENNLQTSSSISKLGIYHYIKGEIDTAIKYQNKVLAIEKSFFGEGHLKLRKINVNLANSYKEQGFYDLASEILVKTSKMIRKELGEDHLDLYLVYYNLASIYYFTGRLNMALDFNQRIIRLLEKNNQDDREFAFIYNKMGLIYIEMDNYIKAIECLKKSIDLKEKVYGESHIAIADGYNNLGTVYMLKDEKDKALQFFMKSLKIKNKRYKGSHVSLANSYKEIGQLYTRGKNIDLALKYLQDALEIRISEYGENNPRVSHIYNLIGNANLANDNYVLAISNFKKAVESNQRSNSSTEVKFSNFLNHNVLLSSYEGQAKAYLLAYRKSLNTNNLLKSQKQCKISDSLIRFARFHNTNYKDKVFFSKKAKDINKIAIEGSMLLYNNDILDLQDVLYFSEKSKANTLIELINNDSKRFSGLPEKIIKFEKKLKIDRSYYQSKIQKEKSESSKLIEFKNKLFSINRKQDSLNEVLEKNYPKYYHLKYNDKVISIVDIQKKIDQETTLLEYFTADSITYAFTISKHDISVQELSTPKLTEQIEAFRKSIIAKNTRAYKQQAYALYNTLIAPVKDKLVGNQLIIIPDGPLWHLNFDLLLTQNDDSNNPALLSYLLKKYAVTYANSANLLFTTFKSDLDTKPLQECLAFSFSDSTQTAETRTISMATLRDAGGDLPGTRKEIKAISDIIDGQYYFGSQAIEANFKSNASQYNILHLALHGEVDNERPENSKLYFTRSKDTIEDNLLYSHELFALDIPAELTVLSACNTGSGKIAKGEGIMSLGTAFQYAGTKSLLLTSWEVSDQTTPELMKYFYTNLKAGMHKGKALQQAKLQYLSTANINRTDPFYWGGFYLVGDTTAMQFNDHTQLYWILGLSIVAVMFLVVFLYRRRIKNG